jgi:hypothetical protein
VCEPFKTTIELKSLAELKEKLDKLPTDRYIYRGHSDSSWKLQSSLERVLGAAYESNAEDTENFALTFFKRRSHLYDNSTFLKRPKLEWLSMMQHYGTPTRLLDFTYSPYVALYFALENIVKPSKDKFAIYAIDYETILKKSLEYLNEHLQNENKSLAIEYNKLINNQDRLFNIIDKKALEILWVTGPRILNPRIERQSGCFLLSGNIKQQIKKLLDSDLYKKAKNYCYIAPCSAWDEIYNLLKRMNIDSRTVYGGLEGLSKSIKTTMLAYL